MFGRGALSDFGLGEMPGEHVIGSSGQFQNRPLKEALRLGKHGLVDTSRPNLLELAPARRGIPRDTKQALIEAERERERRTFNLKVVEPQKKGDKET